MRRLAIMASLVFALPVFAQTPPSAYDSDPVRLKLMQGNPPPAAAQVRWDDGSMWAFPKFRWAFTHVRELVPTVGIRHEGAVSSLPRAERADLDGVRFTAMDGRTMTWRESLDANYTDGILVLHRGRIVYERYLGALGPNGEHIAMSVTKSFVGALAEILIAEGKLDPSRTVGSYVSELRNTGFGDATVRQVMDMRTGLRYTEDYAGLGTAISDTTRMMIASGWSAPPAGYQGPDSNYAFAAGLDREGVHGGDFAYKTPNSVVLGWILANITGQSVSEQLQARFWSRMGMERDASMVVDRQGVPFAGAGLALSLRDLARFGEMIRLGGRWNGRQIMPAAAVRAIMKGGDPAAFLNAGYPGLEGGNYGSQWWHRAGGQTLAIGIHGQGIYIDPRAGLVIVRFASPPTASNRGINPVTIPAYDAIAARLAKSRSE